VLVSFANVEVMVTLICVRGSVRESSSIR